VNVAAKYLQTGLSICLKQRSTGETDEYGIGHNCFHYPVQFAALRAVALIYEDEYFTNSNAGLSL